MSLCVKLKPYNRTCSATTGGIARVWIFDGEDFDFTQAAPAVDGTVAPYTVIALSEDAVAADGALMYPIRFDKKTAEYTYTQSRNGCSVKYAHKLEFQLAELSQLIANWNIAVDKAGCCCGVGLVIQMNSGKILIAGEKYVNGAAISIPLEMQQDGSTGTSGKLMDDPNSQTAIMVGDYNRPLFEYTGTVQSIIDLETA
ncbi:hypothetical protein F0919_17870 [Taibaiella lutea]|uniref:Uncharacterized protein n=1 Tax=Taibaiella lutea TaxID=2608001 RepID=A0A5M6CHM7_9BACT|nr:hypothetical protein [Taibaiella lutea]KAA5532649.1 hypothetical protein F0919_17870 [Taibaiella lutea]